MQPDQWAQWVEVERRATKLLLMRREEGPLLQIMEMPQDGDWVCWEFFSSILGQFVYRSVWKRMEDLAKFQSPDYHAEHAPAPSVKTRSANTPKEFAESTVRDLGRIRFPLMPEYEPEDAPGALIEISVSRPQVNGLVRWHEPGPAEWRDLVEWSGEWRTQAGRLFN